MNGEPILITGVGRRVGLHLAQQFLDRGIAVIGTYRSERDSVIDLASRGAELYRIDFNDETQLELLLETIVKRHRALRAVIHNASEWLPDEHELPASQVMQRMMRVHVSVPYQMNLALAPLLMNSSCEHADIIHVGDYVASRGSRKHIAYAASKAAQDSLTLSFSAKLGPKVKVNSIAPALILFNETDNDEYRRRALRKSLMQREAGLDEFQHGIDYLLNSRYVTGRVLPMDGGRHVA